MTARPQDVALLPLPKYPTDGAGDEDSYNTGWNECLDSCAAALASAQAREDELRAEVERLRSQVSVSCEVAWQQSQYRASAQERAERLEEALRAAMNEAEGCMFEAWLARTCPGGDVESVHRQWEASSEFEDFLNEWSEASAALSTNAATQTGEMT